MSKVLFTITGLSLCKPDYSRMLEVLFIHPMKTPLDKHRLSVTIRKGLAGSSQKPVIANLVFDGKTRFSVTLDNTVPVPSTGLPDFNEIVNFDSYYDRSLPLFKNPNLEISYLSIPQAQPFTAMHDSRMYEVFKYSKAGKIPHPQHPAPRRVGKKVGANFQINDAIPGGSPAGSLTLKIENIDLKLPFTAGMDYEVEFDNRRDHIHHTHGRNDYQFFYEVLEGVDAGGNKLTILFENHEKVDQQACNASSGGGGCRDFNCYFDRGECICP